MSTNDILRQANKRTIDKLNAKDNEKRKEKALKQIEETKLKD